VIRFPDGDFEYDMTRRLIPAIGETIRRKGVLWLVTRVTTDEPIATVYVEARASESSRSSRTG
jgi:hypothetical protein